MQLKDLYLKTTFSVGDGRNVTGLANPVYTGEPGTEYQTGPKNFVRFAAGAFDRSLAESPDVMLLLNHDDQKVLARTPTTLRVFADARGLHFDARLNGTSWANDCLELLKAGQIGGCSPGVFITEEEFVKEGDKNVRLVRQAVLDEISLVYRPAFEATPVRTYKAVDMKAYEEKVKRLLNSL